MKVAVTGASGFIGENLVRHLRASHHEVRAIVRSSGDWSRLRETGAEVVLGDVTDEVSLRRCFTRVDRVVHLAALFNHPEASWETYRNINVEGTRRCLEAARKCEVERFVHCSTVGVAIGPGSPPFDEDTPYHHLASDKYEHTKYEAEVIARSFSTDRDLSVVVLRPAQVYGPGDMSKLKLYRLVKRGVIVNPSHTWKHLIYVSDVCRAFELASTHPGAPGDVFIAGSERPVQLRELIDVVAETLGVKPPSFVIPASPLPILCGAVEVVCGVVRVKPPVFRRSMDFFTRSVQFDTGKIRSILGFEAQTDLRDGIRKTAAWYRERGLI